MPFHFCTDELFAFLAALPMLGFLWAKIQKVKPALQRLWWFIRGVGSQTYRGLCMRCGYTGQLHYSWRSVSRCLRFKRSKE